MARFSRLFFRRYTPTVARELLGAILVRVLDGTTLSGRIVETEAYRGSDDPASHAYRGMTKRTEVMFGEPGKAYVYFTYGNHYCLNVTSERKGEAGATLIRALAPLEGLEEMQRRRGVENVRDVANGPGKLTKAMGIDGSLNGEDLVTSKRLYLVRGERPSSVGVSTRIGLSVAKATEWRFFVDGDEFVSHYRTHNYRKRAAP